MRKWFTNRAVDERHKFNSYVVLCSLCHAIESFKWRLDRWGGKVLDKSFSGAVTCMLEAECIISSSLLVVHHTIESFRLRLDRCIDGESRF